MTKNVSNLVFSDNLEKLYRVGIHECDTDLQYLSETSKNIRNT